MTLTLDAAKYGAKTQTLRGGNPRAMLKRLIDERPTDSEEDLLGPLLELLGVPDAGDALRAVVSYWLTNNRRALLIENSQACRPVQPAPVEPAAEASAVSKNIDKLKSHIKAKAAEMVLLDLALPSGKKLRDSTGRECARAGGWFAKIAAKVAPQQVVGKIMSEDAVRAIWLAS